MNLMDINMLTDGPVLNIPVTPFKMMFVCCILSKTKCKGYKKEKNKSKDKKIFSLLIKTCYPVQIGKCLPSTDKEFSV